MAAQVHSIGATTPKLKQMVVGSAEWSNAVALKVESILPNYFQRILKMPEYLDTALHAFQIPYFTTTTSMLNPTLWTDHFEMDGSVSRLYLVPHV